MWLADFTRLHESNDVYSSIPEESMDVGLSTCSLLIHSRGTQASWQTKLVHVSLAQVLNQSFHMSGSLVPSVINFNSKKNGLINLRTGPNSASTWVTLMNERIRSYTPIAVKFLS